MRQNKNIIRYKKNYIKNKVASIVDEWDPRYSSSSYFASLNWGGTTMWGEPTIKELETVAETHPIVRAAIYEIATTLAYPPLVIGNNEKGEFEIAENHPSLELVLNPNEVISGNMLIQSAALNLIVSGVWYVQKIRAGGPTSTVGEVVKLYNWPSSWVREELSKDAEPVSGYRILSQENLFIPKENMIRIWIPSVSSPWTPSSPLASAYNDIRLDKMRENYQAEMLENTPCPGIGINTGNRPPSPAQQEKIEERLSNRYGEGRRGKPFIYSGEGARIDEVNPLKDYDWPGMGALHETRICATLGVPPIIIGARSGLDRSTYSNYKEAKQSFYDETMSPMWTAIADGLTHQLLLSEGITNLEFQFLLDDLPGMSESLDSKTDRVIKQVAAGIISQNEARIALQYESLGSEYDFIQPATSFVFSENTDPLKNEGELL